MSQLRLRDEVLLGRCQSRGDVNREPNESFRRSSGRVLRVHNVIQSLENPLHARESASRVDKPAAYHFSAVHREIPQHRERAGHAGASADEHDELVRLEAFEAGAEGAAHVEVETMRPGAVEQLLLEGVRPRARCLGLNTEREREREHGRGSGTQ